MIFLAATNKELLISKIAKINKIILESKNVNKKKPGTINIIELIKKYFVCLAIANKFFPSINWIKFEKIMGIKIKEIESFISKINDNKTSVIVGKPTPMVPLTTPPIKKINKTIKKVKLKPTISISKKSNYS